MVQIKKNVLVKGRTKTVKTLTYVSAKSERLGLQHKHCEKNQLFKYIQGRAALVMQIIKSQERTVVISGKFNERLDTHNKKTKHRILHCAEALIGRHLH